MADIEKVFHNAIMTIINGIVVKAPCTVILVINRVKVSTIEMLDSQT